MKKGKKEILLKKVPARDEALHSVLKSRKELVGNLEPPFKSNIFRDNKIK